MKQPIRMSIIAGLLMATFCLQPGFCQDRKAEAEKLVKEADELGLDERQRCGDRQIQAAAAIWEELGDRATKSWSILREVRLCRRLGDSMGAIPVIERSLALAREIGDKTLETDALMTLAQGYGTLGDHRKAIEFYSSRADRAREIKDKQYEAISTRRTWSFSSDTRSAKSGAINYYNQSLPVVRSINDKQRNPPTKPCDVYLSLGEDRSHPSRFTRRLLRYPNEKDEQHFHNY